MCGRCRNLTAGSPRFPTADPSQHHIRIWPGATEACVVILGHKIRGPPEIGRHLYAAARKKSDHNKYTLVDGVIRQGLQTIMPGAQ